MLAFSAKCWDADVRSHENEKYIQQWLHDGPLGGSRLVAHWAAAGALAPPAPAPPSPPGNLQGRKLKAPCRQPQQPNVSVSPAYGGGGVAISCPVHIDDSIAVVCMCCCCGAAGCAAHRMSRCALNLRFQSHVLSPLITEQFECIPLPHCCTCISPCWPERRSRHWAVCSC